MTRPYPTFSLLLLLISLGVSQPTLSQSDATAEYSVKFTGNWTLTSTPGGVVGGAHFTTIAGGKHNSSASFWKSGEKATSGLESLAELGLTSGFINEINASTHTDASFTSGVGGGGTGTSTFTLNMKRTHPLVTFGSMIGPSPDWFVGLSGYSLLDSDSNWVSTVTVNLYPYDAGTEDGDDFSLSNPATNPQGVITSIRGVGKFSNAAMATISFTRQDTPPPSAPTITAIERAANASQYTNTDSVTWLVTFSEAVQNVSTDDFVVSGTTATVTSVATVSGSTTQYRVVVTGGNLANLNATISLGLATSQNITNSSSVGLSSTLPTSSETYVIDNVAPRILSISPSSADVSPFTATITFNESIRSGSFNDVDDVTSDDADVSAPNGSGLSFNVTVSLADPSQASTITLIVPADAATDLAGNTSTRYEATIEYTPDLTRIPPIVNQVTAISPDGLYHASEEVEVGVSFSQSVTVTGTPALMLQFDNGPRAAPYDRGSGTQSLVFSYTLAPGDTTSDLGYVDTQAIHLAGGTIVGVGGLSADLTLPAPGTSGSLSQTSNIRTSGQQDTEPSFAGASVEDQVLMMNQQIDAIQLPSASGGNAPLQYDLEPNLPPGLELDTTSHEISGTPTTVLDVTTFTWSVTDEDGDVTSLTFTIMILPELPLQFPSSAKIEDQIFLQNDLIKPIDLPAARGGDGELTYSLSPNLPTGLTLQLAERQIAGTPTVVLSRTTFTWRVTDEENASADLTFDMSVLEDFQPRFETALTNIDESIVAGSAVAPIKLPGASGGNGRLTYELDSELPEGLILDSESLEITGSPSTPTNRTLFIWTVRDEDGDSATFDVYITVLKDVAPSFAADASISEQVFTSESAIEPVQLPTAIDGNDPLRYVLSPDLPNGLELNTTSFEISGTPEQATPRTLFTWSVHDVDGDSESISFYLTVIQDEQPQFAAAVADKTFEERTPIASFTLPRASGGNGQLEYALTPELPNGLELDSASGMISGTPTAVFEPTEFSWTATDEDGDIAELTFKIVVLPRTPLHFPPASSIPNQVFLQNDPISTIELPSALGGFGEFTYSLSPELPSGLSLDLEGKQISGTPIDVLDETEFTWRVTDEDGESVALTFAITVLVDLQPVFDVLLSPIDETFIQNSPITPFTLLSASSGNGQLTYRLEPALPEGLVLNDISFEITGVPTVPSNRTLFGWTVTDEDGDSVTFNFHITVLKDVTPSFTEGVSIADQEYISDSAIEPFRLPLATGGNGYLSYSLSPDLPNGVGLSPLLYEVSGTPTTAQERTRFTWTATDVDGDAVSLQFYLTVIQDTQPIFTTQVEDKVFVMGMVIESFMLPEASGGNGALTYEFSPQLPDGLSFHADSASISGTPIAESPMSTYNWSVTDADGDTTTLTFAITVNPASPTVIGSLANVQLFVGGSSQMTDANSAVGGSIDTWGIQVNNSDVVSGVISSSGVLTLSPIFEGQSSVMVTASNVTGSVQLSFSVSVVTDSAEDDQIDSALSLKAGAILSSAMNVFKHRTHAHDASTNFGETSAIGRATVTGLDEKSWMGYQESNPNSYEHSIGYGLRPVYGTKSSALGSDFVPLSFSHTSTRWRMWGAVDLQNFSRDASQNEIDGSLSSLYVGGDIAVNENTFAGLAVARHSGSGSYEFSSSAANGAAEIDTTLFSFYPYLQAGDGNRFSMFLVGGIGYGESQIDRRHANGLDQDSDTDMTLFAGGFDYVVLRRSTIDFSIVGDAGVATLTTVADSGVLAGRDSASSKSSIGGSVSFNPQIEGGTMVTSIDLRLANGAEGDDSGSGFELGANLNFIGDHIDVMLDGRTTSRSADADVTRSSISGRLRYRAKTDGSNLTVTLTPRWNDGSLVDIRRGFNTSVHAMGIERFSRNSGRSLAAEVGYGFWTHNGTALFKPRFAWHATGVNDNTLKLGSMWQLVRNSRTGPAFSVDLLRETTDHVGESLGVIARFDLVF